MAHGQGGRPPYWVAARLAAVARDQWHTFDGWCAARNVDPLDLPADRYCNLVYYWMTRGADQKRRERIDYELEQPPEGASPDGFDDGAWSADAEMAAFHAAQRAASSR